MEIELALEKSGFFRRAPQVKRRLSTPRAGPESTKIIINYHSEIKKERMGHSRGSIDGRPVRRSANGKHRTLDSFHQFSIFTPPPHSFPLIVGGRTPRLLFFDEN